jgi:hypothetical protein
MRVVTNEALVRKRVRLAAVLHLTALVIFAGGLFFSLQPTLSEQAFLISYGTIVIGLVLYNFAQLILRRYGPRHRFDRVLERLLRGLDARFTLYNFLSPQLPDYLLVGPSGVLALVPRSQGGAITCERDRWSAPRGRLGFLSALFGGGLGNPSQDASRALAALHDQFRRRRPAGLTAEDLAAQALIVFTSEGTKLQLNGCSFPATTARELRNVVRRQRDKLAPEQVERLKAAFVELRA